MTWLHSTRVIYWVKWYKAGFCKEAFVNGFSIRVLSNQGKGGDDTSLNALYLYCQNYQFLASKILKIWHDEHRKNNFWRDYYYCDENTFLNGQRVKIEPDQARLADDTSVNSIEISCSNGKILKPNNGGDWGDWDIWRKCPEGSFICAMEVQLELNNAITFHSYSIILHP